MRFYLLEKFINLHDGYRRVFKIDEHQLLLLQENGERYLIEAFCPHRGHSLETAEIAEDCVTCPLHNYCFSLRNGKLQTFTEDSCRDLRRYDLVDRDIDLGVML